MKIYIFADMEGISGVAGTEYISGQPHFVELARRYMADDINSCAEGCFEAGATEVIVRDGHSVGFNVDPDRIDPRVTLIQGAAPRGVRFPDIEGSHGLILLGYHAMAGTEGALLEHSYSSRQIQNLWLNGRRVGEIGLDAAIASEHKVPVLMVSGDDKACQEAVLWIPNVRACQVKKSYDTQGTRLVIPSAAHAMIKEYTIEAIRHRRRCKLLPLEYPATLRTEYIERVPLPGRSDWTRIDGRTVERTGDSIERLLVG